MSKKIISLNEEQRELVNANMDVVKWTIKKYIRVNEHIEGLGYDDLYQTGCMALCHAAVTYNGSVQFDTYAGVVIRNKLTDHCRSAMKRQNHTVTASVCVQDDTEYSYDKIFGGYDDTYDSIESAESIEALSQAKQRYNGVTLKGIEAMELKVKGYTGKEIAEMYGVSQNNVSAWISRAASKLRQDRKFLAAILMTEDD